jgi:tetratricopeptide (TPR) repeat protein
VDHVAEGERALRTSLCALALLTFGCAPDAERSSPAPVTAPSTSAGDALRPVALPDLSRLEPPVREQLRDQFNVLTTKREAAGTPATDLGEAYGALGKLFMAAKEFDLAEPFILNAQALIPGDRRWPYYLGHIYKAKGALTQAAASFTRALTRQPDDPSTLIWLGEIHLLDGRPAEAAPLFARARASDPRNLAARFGEGRAALARRDYGAAAGHFEKLLALNPRANVHYPLALAYRGLGDIAKAEAHLGQRGDFEVVAPDPLMEELREVLHSAVAFEIRGTRALNASDWKAAADEFRQGLTLEPSNPTLRHKLGTALYMLGDLRGAQDAFEQVIRESPAYARAHYSLGVLLESQQRHQAAIERFSAAVAREPDYVEARIQLAELLRRSGRLQEAIAHYDRGLALDPRLAEAALGRALTLVRLRRYADAHDRLHEAAQFNSDNPWIAHALARLLAAAPDDRVRDGRQALAIMQTLPEKNQRLDLGETMGMALAEAGRYQEAAAWQRSAILAARQAGQNDLAERMAERLRLYESNKPCRTPWRDDELW